MNYTRLQQIVNDNINGATIISIDTTTSVTLTGGKKNPMQGRVTKSVVGSNVMIFQNKNIHGYQNMVIRRLEKEGKNPNFELSPRKWGSRIPNEPFVEHNGNYYFEVIFLRSGTTTYYLDGQEISKEEIVGLPSRNEGAQGGLSDKVIIRTYGCESIDAITINKQRFISEDDVDWMAVS